MNGRLIAALAIVIIAFMLGMQGLIMHSAVRGFGWAIGREAAYGVLGHRRW